MRTQVQPNPRTLASGSGSTPGIEAIVDDDSIGLDGVPDVGTDAGHGTLRLSERSHVHETGESAGDRSTTTTGSTTPESAPELTEATDEQVHACIRAVETDSGTTSCSRWVRSLPFVSR